MIKNFHIRRAVTTCANHQALTVNQCHEKITPKKHKFALSEPKINENYLLDVKNLGKINENIQQRKGVGDIYLVHDIHNKLKSNSLSNETKAALERQLQDEMRKIPNDTHPDVKFYGEVPKEVAFFNEMPRFKHSPLEFSEICKKLNLLRTDHLGNFSGHKTYYLMHDLAELVSTNLLKKIICKL